MVSLIQSFMSQQTLHLAAKKQKRWPFQTLRIDTNHRGRNTGIRSALDLQSQTETPELIGRPRRETIGTIRPSHKQFQLTEKFTRENFNDLFENKGILGEGAHSTVFQYLDKKTKKSLAVKVFKNCDNEILRDIKNSYMIMKELSHPYILEAYNLFIEEKSCRCYLTTELCTQKELRLFIQDNRAKGIRVTEEKVAQIIKKLLVSLIYLKGKGVCHRDIKPENILYDPATRDIKIIDFELAKMKKYSHERISLWSDTGSLFYRAPESFAFGYGESIDVWAVGVITFQMLTGKLPFFSSSISTTAAQIKTHEIDYDRLDISSEAKRFLKEILQKNPKKRLTPEEAIKSSFILKYAPLRSCKSPQKGMEQALEEPSLKKSCTTLDDDDEHQFQHKFYDDSFKTSILRLIQKNSGIYILK